MGVRRLPIVGVIGSGSDPYPDLARPAGRIAAELGCHLLTGGGGGAMREAARSFCAVRGRSGLSIGILKGEAIVEIGPDGATRELRSQGRNEWVEIGIQTHLPLSGAAGTDTRSRNHINVLTSDFLIALPGGEGTYSEAILRIEYGLPLILFLGSHSIAGRGIGQILVKASREAQIRVAASEAELYGLVRRRLAERSGG